MKFALWLLFIGTLWAGLEMSFRLGRARGHLDVANNLPTVRCVDAAPADGWSR